MKGLVGRRVAIAAALCFGTATAAQADPWFGFSRVQEDCWYVTEAEVFGWIDGEEAWDDDTDSGIDPVSSSASLDGDVGDGDAGGSVTASVAVQPNGSGNASVNGIINTVKYGGADIAGRDDTTTVQELQGGELAPGQTFTIKGNITASWGSAPWEDTGTYTAEACGETLTMAHPGDGWVYITYPDGTTSSLPDTGGVTVGNVVLCEEAELGTRVTATSSTSNGEGETFGPISEITSWTVDITAIPN